MGGIPFIAKLNADDLSSEWLRTYPVSTTRILQNLAISPMGNIVTAAKQFERDTDATSIVVQRLSLDGDVLWARHLESKHLNVTDIAATKRGIYVALHRTRNRTQTFHLQAISQHGKPKWAQSLPVPAGSFGYREQFQITAGPDGGVFAVGPHWRDVPAIDGTPSWRRLENGSKLITDKKVEDTKSNEIGFQKMPLPNQFFITRFNDRGQQTFQREIITKGEIHEGFRIYGIDASTRLYITGASERQLSFGGQTLQRTGDGLEKAFMATVNVQGENRDLQHLEPKALTQNIFIPLAYNTYKTNRIMLATRELISKWKVTK